MKMDKLRIATAQFENASADKKYNLTMIEGLAAKAAATGVKIIAFHECSISGYTFARHLSREQMLEISEYIPGGESIQQLTTIAKKYDITILAGLFEKDNEEKIYNTYVCVDRRGLIAKFRKLHPFI